METPSDSDQSQRERKKTAVETFFGEEPVFSDSEEADFSRLAFGRRQEDRSVPEDYDLQVSNSLLESILKACCRECICCRKILLLFHSTKKCPAPNQSLSPSFKVQNYSTPAKGHLQQSVEKPNSSKQVNVISSHVLPSSEALLQSETNSSNQIDSKCSMPNIASSNSLDGKAKRGKRKSLHLKRSRKRKFDQCVESKERDANESGTTNELSKSNNRLSDPDQQTDNDAGNNSLTTAKVENSSVEVTNKMVRRKLEYRTGKIGNNRQENVENNRTASDTGKSRPAKRLCKEKIKSMADTVKLEETLLDGSVAKPKLAQSKKRKSVYSMIDERIFKMSIDTTADRGFVKAITRKLARRGGTVDLDTFSKHNESFRLQKTQKLKKLYSPTEWLDSPIFESICKYDV